MPLIDIPTLSFLSLSLSLSLSLLLFQWFSLSTIISGSDTQVSKKRDEDFKQKLPLGFFPSVLKLR